MFVCLFVCLFVCIQPSTSSGSNLDLFGIDSLQPTIVNSSNSNNGRAGGGGLGMVGGMSSHNSGTGLSQPQQPAMRSSSMPVPNQAAMGGGRFPGQGQGGGMMGGGVQGMNMNINGMGLPFNGIQHPMGGGGGGAMGPMGGMQQQQKPQGQGQGQPGGLGQGLGQGGQMQFDAFSGMRPTGMQQQPPSNPNNPQQQNPRRF